MFPELITAGIALVIGSIIKLMAVRMDMKHQEQRALMEKAGLVESARKYGKKDLDFGWTRRVIALTLLATVTSTVWGPVLGMLLNADIIVNVPAVDKTTVSAFFGILSYSTEDNALIPVHGITTLPQHLHYFAAVMGLYFGTKIASR